MSDSTKSRLGIKSLPSDLEESLMALKNDISYLKICFQTELIETLHQAKRRGNKRNRQG